MSYTKAYVEDLQRTIATLRKELNEQNKENQALHEELMALKEHTRMLTGAEVRNLYGKVSGH